MTDQPDAAAAQPAQMRVLSQYVKGVSFQNTAAKSNKNPTGKPNISVNVNVTSDEVGGERHSVTLTTVVKATSGDDEIFTVDLDYVGVFQLTNVPPTALQPVLLIQCPQLLFPFSRRIIAEVTRDGGFPPLMLDPIDFATLYRQQRARETADA